MAWGRGAVAHPVQNGKAIPRADTQEKKGRKDTEGRYMCEKEQKSEAKSETEREYEIKEGGGDMAVTAFRAIISAHFTSL